MHDAALVVPLVFAKNGDSLTNSQALQPRCQVDVVGNQQGQPAICLDDEALMARSVTIVGQKPLHLPFYLQLSPLRVLLKGPPGRILIGGVSTGR